MPAFVPLSHLLARVHGVQNAVLLRNRTAGDLFFAGPGAVPTVTAATASFSKDSRSITWHQWQAEYPIERKIGLSSRRAAANASSPHGYQSTGLSACCSR